MILCKYGLSGVNVYYLSKDGSRHCNLFKTITISTIAFMSALSDTGKTVSCDVISVDINLDCRFFDIIICQYQKHRYKAVITVTLRQLRNYVFIEGFRVSHNFATYLTHILKLDLS